MKGVAATMTTILLILILLFFLVVFVTTLNNDAKKSTTMNFRQSEVLKLENTYLLLNKTMETTWYISAVQSVFNATGQSLLCGKDDAELLGGDDALPPKYWYQYDKSNGAKDIGKVESFISNPDGNSIKYNNDEPTVCYPANENAITVLEGAFEVFKDIANEFTANGIIIKIDKINTLFSFTGHGIESSSRQFVSLTSTNGAIEENTNSVNHIYTDFPKMINFGRLLVHRLTGISDAFYPNNVDSGTAYDSSLKYRDLNTPLMYMPDASKASYMSRISGLLNSEISSLEDASSFDKTKASIEYHNLELFAPHESGDENIFGAPEVGGYGLVLHYNISVNLNEGGVGGACQFPLPENYQELIEQQVNSKAWIFDKNEYTNSEITAFVSAIMQRESSWNPEAVSCAGALGLGQLMPGTARNLGLNVPNYGTADTICGGKQWDNAPVCNAKTPELCDIADERFIPEKNIMGSVLYLHQLFGMMKGHSDDKTELLRLVAASYNAGPGRVEDAIANSGVDPVRYDDIKNKLPLETQIYVMAVSGFYMCYGGSLPMAGDFYYYHDEKNNRFSKKPFSMEVKAEDYLPAIDCADSPVPNSPVRFFSWEKQPRYSTINIQTGDMACCGGGLWTCNAEVDGMSGDKKLSTGMTAGGVCGSILISLGLGLVCEDEGFNLEQIV